MNPGSAPLSYGSFVPRLLGRLEGNPEDEVLASVAFSMRWASRIYVPLAMFHVKQLSVLGPVAGWSTGSKVQVRHVSRETSNQSISPLRSSFVRQLARRHVSLADSAL